MAQVEIYSYANYRYRSFQNHSFQNEFGVNTSSYADFTGSNLKSCDFRGTRLVGADFSETEIGRDEKNFKFQISIMAAHVILGIPLGLLTWLLSKEVWDIRGDAVGDYYTWLTNPFVWIAAFATAASISKLWLLGLFVGLIVLTTLVAVTFSAALPVIAVIDLFMMCLMALDGMYLGDRKGSIAVGTIWLVECISSAISAAYSWLKLSRYLDAIMFAILAIFPAIMAIRAFDLHFAKVRNVAMTSFLGADLTDARFMNAVLQNCDFRKAKLAGVDWRGATFENCKFPKNFTGS